MSAYGDEAEEEGAAYEDVDEGTEKKSTTEGLLPSAPGSAKGTPQQSAVSCCCLLWSLIWLAVLVAFAWPLSVAMAALYGFVAPLITLIGLDDISDSMLQAVHVGRECARNVRTGSTQAPRAVNCCCLLWSLIWLAVLAAFAWPLSVAMAALYGFVAPLITLIGLDDISDSMLQAVHVGRECARNVRTGKPMI